MARRLTNPPPPMQTNQISERIRTWNVQVRRVCLLALALVFFPLYFSGSLAKALVWTLFIVGFLTWLTLWQKHYAERMLSIPATEMPIVGYALQAPASVPRVPLEPPAEPNEDQCGVCLDGPARYAFIPCGHKALCGACLRGNTWNRCPICRAVATDSLRVYRVCEKKRAAD